MTFCVRLEESFKGELFNSVSKNSKKGGKPFVLNDLLTQMNNSDKSVKSLAQKKCDNARRRMLSHIHSSRLYSTMFQIIATINEPFRIDSVKTK